MPILRHIRAYKQKTMDKLTKVGRLISAFKITAIFLAGITGSF